MFILRIVSIITLVCGSTAMVSAQSSPPDSGPYANGQVIQAVGSGTVASRMLNQASYQQVKSQIRFEIQLLYVDAEMRDKLYESIGSENIHTQVTRVNEPTTESTQSGEVIASESELDSQHQTTSASVVTSAVMSKQQRAEILQMVSQREHCKVVARPVMIAADGQVAGLQQQVQRPFLAELEPVENDPDAAATPGIQVLNEGVKFAVLADVVQDGLQLTTRIEQSTITDVQQYSVYGVGPSQTTLQIPTHQVRIAKAKQIVTENQTFLLDPYFQTVKVHETEVGTPIPYLNRSFRSSKKTEQVQQNLIVLLTAKKL
ncbi:type II and III secretion system protein [Stieleria sp. TO1_6]|uniref:type II and III secretion system protein n=1 Tax=Stieleria tagensis TaxID=2956795 RepID=UPI00209B6170|nr:type II and III secretion system protein [Stieleria tagensis]MCO8121990.1 type II and III secretion system protein [Stieleria tagensis]